MQTSDEAQPAWIERSLEHLQTLEDERARLTELAHTTQSVIDEIDQEYAVLYEILETFALTDHEIPSKAAPSTSVRPSDPPILGSIDAEDRLEDDAPARRNVSRWLVSSATSTAVVLGLVAYFASFSGEASAPAEPHTRAPVVIEAAIVPEDTQEPTGTQSYAADRAQSTAVSAKSKSARKHTKHKRRARTTKRRGEIRIDGSRDPLAGL